MAKDEQKKSAKNEKRRLKEAYDKYSGILNGLRKKKRIPIQRRKTARKRPKSCPVNRLMKK